MVLRITVLISALLSLATCEVSAQTDPGPPPATGRQLFDRLCTSCHGNADVPRAVDPAALRRMLPERIYESLSTGTMQSHAEGLTDTGLRSIAEYLGERKLGLGASGDASTMPNRCEPAPLSIAGRPAWNGWGGGLSSSRAQTAEAAGLPVERVAALTLKWAFGVPGATTVAMQPTVVGGRVFIGADTGYVYALDAASGCVHWSYRARGGVRGAGVVGTIAGRRSALFFGDMKGRVYAVDASTGAEIWVTVADDHALARITAAPVLHEGRLYVGVASGEEGASTSARYSCCTFRGSVSAIDASTGKVVWKAYTISDAPARTNAGATGTARFGPSGAGVWSAPTIDPARRVLYVGTGNAYSHPVTANTDSILAMALDTGRIVWSMQATKGDAWIPACNPAALTGNCPSPLGPDFDFGASPVLVTRPNGAQILVAAQKNGVLWALDPDRQGAVVWQSTPPPTPVNAEGEFVWGVAVDGARAYSGLTSGGVAAIDLANGAAAWITRLTAGEGRRGGHSGAVSLTPGVVWSAGWDGVLRALASDTGREVWSFDTLREFETANRVAGRGGSMGAAGPIVAGGMVFVGSGYIGVRSGTPGNVLLAFGPK